MSRDTRIKNSRARGPFREKGSAYVIVLLVLVVLTILGLSVSLVTEVEILASGQERSLERVFYAAESGVHLAVANVLSRGRYNPSTHLRNPLGTASGAVVELREQVETSPFICVADVPCDLCSINQGRQFSRRNHLVASAARRVGLDPADEEVVLARKDIASAVDVEPFTAGLNCLADIEAATKGYRYDKY